MMLHARSLTAATTPTRSGLLFVAGSSSSSSSGVGAAGVMRRVTALRNATRMQAPSAQRRTFSSKSSGGGNNEGESFFRRAWTRYNALLETHPLATKVVTGGAIAGIGDINCQLFLERDAPFDAKRAATFTFLGGAFISPILHVWYGFLGRAIPGTATTAVAKRLVLDQFVFAPAFLPVFFTTLLTLEGDADKVPEKLAQDWWPAVKANWVVWVPAQLLNFRFVPGSLQVLFSNVVGLFWNSYLSFVSHSEALPASAPAPAADESAADESAPVAAPAVPKPLLTN